MKWKIGVVCTLMVVAGCSSGPAGHSNATRACKEWQQFRDDASVPLSYAIEDAFAAAQANPKYQSLKSDLDAAGLTTTPGIGVSRIVDEDCAAI